ncbi:MAG: tripartite tricarboxylate transporter substrate binding protein [Betaproteobacteria bacterium]|nr:tripartite tricarboxylate transporter substrate binding protein [Betaproteobacteria bacterium]
MRKNFKYLILLTFFVASGLAVISATSTPTHAQTNAAWPTKPVRLIIPFPPGASTNDIMGRALALRLSEALGQQFVVDNRPGAGGNLGSEIGAKAVADGYTLLIGTNGPIAISPHIYKTLGYDPLRDLAPVTLYAMVPYAIVVHASVKANNLNELIALAKASPGKLLYASSGSGGTPHLCMEMFKSQLGIDITHVPYKGGAPATIDLLAGQVQVFCPGLPPVLPHIKSGKLRALALTMPKRSAFLPDVPTATELGQPKLDVNSWVGVLAPAKTPPAIIEKLHTAISRIMAQQDMRNFAANNGAEAMAMGPAEFGVFLRNESAKWGQVAKAANLRVE